MTDRTLSKSLPNEIDAERMILGVILLDNSTLIQAQNGLDSPDDFFLESHRLIYRRMLDLDAAGRAIDPVTLQSELAKAGQLEHVGGPATIASLFDGVPRFSNIESYVAMVRDAARRRRVIYTAHKILNDAWDGEEAADVLLDKAIGSLSAHAAGDDRKRFYGFGEIGGRLLEDLEQRAQNDRGITGLSTGFHDLDYMTAGLHPGQLITLAARPKKGKTALAANIAENVCTSKVNYAFLGRPPVVAYFSLEMGVDEIGHRILCGRARIDGHRYRLGRLTKDEWRQAAIATEELAQTRLLLRDAAGLTLGDLRSSLRRIRHEQKALDLVIVDYLQLMNPEGRRGDNRVNEITRLTVGLKQIAKEFACTVLMLSQLNREPDKRADQKPQLSDLRDSGSVEQDSDAVLFIWEDPQRPDHEALIRQIIVAAQRSGPTGIFPLIFLSQYTLFQNCERQREGDQ